MSTSDRQRLIMEHLNLTGNLNFNRLFRGSQPQALPIREAPPMTPDSRKKGIKEHLARSSPNFNSFSLGSKDRQQQIKEHVRLSLD